MDIGNPQVPSLQQKKILELKSTLKDWESRYASLYKRTKKYKADGKRASSLKTYYYKKEYTEPTCEGCEQRNATITELQINFKATAERFTKAMDRKKDLPEKIITLEREAFVLEYKMVDPKRTLVEDQWIDGHLSDEQYHEKRIALLLRIIHRHKEEERQEQKEKERREEFEKERNIDLLKERKVAELKKTLLGPKFGHRLYIKAMAKSKMYYGLLV